jgi:prolyl 3-hydroxylase /prolyl 3,4-dihydroxylase
MISCSAVANTLHLVLRDASLLRFVKFVSHDAPSSRYDVAAEFLTDLAPEEVV